MYICILIYIHAFNVYMHTSLCLRSRAWPTTVIVGLVASALQVVVEVLGIGSPEVYIPLRKAQQTWLRGSLHRPEPLENYMKHIYYIIDTI